MRVKKAVERKRAWFPVPGDEDGAKIEVRLLTPGEASQVLSQSLRQEFVGGKPTQVSDTFKDMALTAFFSLCGWENVFEDEDGNKPLKFNDANKHKLLDGVDGFQGLVLDCRMKLLDETRAAAEAERKNSEA